MKKSKTKRGFIIYKFKDDYGGECSLQASSRTDKSQVWLGLDNYFPSMHPVLGESLGMRMLLDIKLTKKLAKLLLDFAESGELH